MSLLFLTSAGIKIPIIAKEFKKILPKPPKDLTLIHITTASKVVSDTTYVNKDRQAMKKMGFKLLEYNISDKNKDEVQKKLEKADIIYVQGGNGFYLLKQVRRSGFDVVVKDLIKKGIMYVGVSAGTYIACPTIEMQTWKKEVDNRYGLKNLKAMNLVPFLITVHYNREKYRQLLKTKIPHTSCQVKVLTDEQALIVRDSQVNLIGNGEEISIF